jgi:hypothetical protein
MLSGRELTGQARDPLARTEILHVNVSTEPGVIGQVPAIVVRVFVNHDGIALPIPIINVIIIIGGHAEEEAAEPEAFAVASAQVVNVTTAKAAREATMFPGTIEVIMGIITTGIVTNPSVIPMDVGSLRMVWSITERAIFLLWVSLSPAISLSARSISRWRWTMCGHVAMPNVASAAAMLLLPSALR